MSPKFFPIAWKISRILLLFGLIVIASVFVVTFTTERKGTTQPSSSSTVEVPETLKDAVFFNGQRPEITEITYTNDVGKEITIPAYAGQVLVFARGTFTYYRDKNCAVDFLPANTRVLMCLPAAAVWMVEVERGKEREFIETMRQSSDVALAVPNLVEKNANGSVVDLSDARGYTEADKLVPAILSDPDPSSKVIFAVIDNFSGQTPHGVPVTEIAETASGNSSIMRIDLGSDVVSTDMKFRAFAAVIAGAQLNGKKVVINHSFGFDPATTDRMLFDNAKSRDPWAQDLWEEGQKSLLWFLANVKWAQQNNVLVALPAGNGVELHNANGVKEREVGINMTKPLERLRADGFYGSVLARNVVHCGALTKDGKKPARYSHYGSGVLMGIPQKDEGTSFTAPQCAAAVYGAWKANSDTGSDRILAAAIKAGESKRTAEGLLVLNPEGIQKFASASPPPFQPSPPRSTPEPIAPQAESSPPPPPPPPPPLQPASSVFIASASCTYDHSDAFGYEYYNMSVSGTAKGPDDATVQIETTTRLSSGGVISCSAWQPSDEFNEGCDREGGPESTTWSYTATGIWNNPNIFPTFPNFDFDIYLSSDNRVQANDSASVVCQ